MAEIESGSGVVAKPPQSIAQASIDDKGRVKLTSEFVAYFEATGIKEFFITTVDMRLPRIYPMPLWESNEIFLTKPGPRAAGNAKIGFIARVHGDKAEIDGSGRLMLPAKLREALGLEKGPVWLEMHGGRINMMTKKMFDERMGVAVSTLTADVEAAEEEGLQ